jgi:hypothetical protein
MRINIELDSENKGDLTAFLNLLTGFGTEQTIVKTDQRTAVIGVDMVSARAAYEQAQTAAPVVESAPEPQKRTRRTKAEIEAAKAEEAANTPATQPATPTATTLPPATEQSSAPISIDDLRAALQGFTSAQGMPAGIDLLKKFGCSRISELAAKDEATKQGFLKDATV